jgi:hypothetical protein
VLGEVVGVAFAGEKGFGRGDPRVGDIAGSPRNAPINA